MRPLDRLRSIKAKLGVVIVASAVISVAIVLWGWKTGIRPRFLVVITGVVALTVILVLAHGMTKPLREMAAATRRITEGDFDVRVTATSRDEVGELARAFNVMVERAAELDAQRRGLIANVSHELRTPLAAVRARLENILDGVEVADAERIGAMLRSVERLGRLVEQLLDVSRLEGGEPLSKEPFAVREVIDAVVEEARLVEARTDLVVDVEGDPYVDGDPERVHQVLANLVENGLRHSPPDAPVEIAAGRRNGRVWVAVSDRGPGIPADVGDRIFDRHYRADGSTQPAGGAGLGLSIARWIVDLHGGSIRSERVAPNGCRMVVELPAVHEHRD